MLRRPAAWHFLPGRRPSRHRRSTWLSGGAQDADRPRLLRQVVSRTADTIHIAGSDRREWLFERNTIDPRRVSAAVVEHASQTIVLYEESDLRMMFGIRGWADVLTLGFDSETLVRYKPTREVHAIGGIRFSRWAATDRAGSASDVWWSNEHALPAEFATGDGPGGTRVLIERARAGVNPAVVAPALHRFPKYRVVELADWDRDLSRLTLDSFVSPDADPQPQREVPCAPLSDKSTTPSEAILEPREQAAGGRDTPRRQRPPGTWPRLPRGRGCDSTTRDTRSAP